MEAIYISFLIAGGVLTLLFFLIVGASKSPGSSDWNEKWPPIDDEEFVQRCRTGVNRDVALRVRRVVSETLGIPYFQVYPDQNFVHDLDCV